MPLLFSPISIKTMTLKNRVVFPPIATNYGLRNNRVRHYLAERSLGGAGLVIIQGTPIELLASEKWIAALKPVVDSVHASGAAIGIQLWAGNELPNKDKVAPSARNEYREVSIAQLETVAKLFADAARDARDAGFDTINIHGAHGYFLHQFFSPLTNQRKDRFGGSLAKRIVFPIQCVQAIRTAVGADFPIMYRFSAVEYAPGGITLEDSLIFARELAGAGSRHPGCLRRRATRFGQYNQPHGQRAFGHPCSFGGSSQAGGDDTGDGGGQVQYTGDL